MKTGTKRGIRHRLNPLHVYCRLCDCGLSSERARKLSNLYERVIYKRLTRRLGASEPFTGRRAQA